MKTKMDLKLTLTSDKFNSIIPLNVSTWLKDIRHNTEPYDEIPEWKPKCRNNLINRLNVSNVSIYDNVSSDEDDDTYEKIEIPPRPPARKESIGIQLSEEYQEIGGIPPRTLDTIVEENPHEYQELDFTAKRKSDLKSSTWPMRKYPRIPDHKSVKDILRYILTKDDMEMWFRLKDDNHRIIHFNWLNSKLTMIKRVLNLNDVTREGKDLAESRTQERVESNLFALMSNLLATCREKLTRECVWSLSNDRQEEEDPFEDILTGIKNDINEFERRMAIFEKEGDFYDNVKNLKRNSLPNNFSPVTEFRYYNVNNIFDDGVLKEKPPVPPKRNKKMDERKLKPLAGKRRKLPKELLARFEPQKTLEECGYETVEQVRAEVEKLKEAEEIVKEAQDEDEEEEKNKPFPFPVEEYEMQELLMMKRVTESSKERRKPIERRISLNYTIHEEPVSPTVLARLESLEESKVAILGYQNEIIQFLDSKAKRDLARNRNIRLREDVIIDWANDYENLNEPVVMQAKSLFFPPKETRKEEKVNEETGNTKGVDNDTEKATYAEINVQKNPPEENSLSDFETDINETIEIGESWCNEDVELRRLCYDKMEPFGDPPQRSKSDNRLDTILEEPQRRSLQITVHLVKSIRTTKSEADLIEKCTKPQNPTFLSKSLDFFNDPLTEERTKCNAELVRSDSMSSDVVEWMARMRGIIYGEDKFFADEDEWYSSCDTEGRVYFFEENSNESSWALPDFTPEDSNREGFNFGIQRSATESALSKSNESSAKLRHAKNEDKSSGRVSSSTRSSKTQSMVIEPKLDFSSKDDSKTFSMPRGDLRKIFGEIIRTGVLNKTKIGENGKKLRKNWTPAFAVLNDQFLFFFKDVKSFQNMKNVITPGSNHICLSLKGAVIEKGDKISSRKNVYKISSDNTEILIQTDKSSEADDWCKDISLVTEKLPQEPVNISSSSSIDPNSPSKVGRTKSLKVKSKETGSMEDLSASPEERQNKIKAKLKKFFNRRPTVDSLKKKGIYKDEPVFGCSLEQTTKNRKPRVPIFVQECVKYIESKEENMKTDGLYRASGNLSQVQKIRLEVDQNNLSIMKDEEDVHVLTGSLKLFFRELKEPLIPFKQLETALRATDKPSRKDRIKDFQKLVKSLPEPNHDTLKFLLQHLLKVKEYQEFNRMNISNLAIVFGPTLMWPEQESANMALELMQQNVVIECLLKEFHEIFIH